MIRSFRSKALRDFFQTGKSAKVSASLRSRVLRCLDALDQTEDLSDLHTPGLRCHKLQGHYPDRYAISVNGPWRIPFEFEDGDVLNVDLEQYH